MPRPFKIHDASGPARSQRLQDIRKGVMFCENQKVRRGRAACKRFWEEAAFELVSKTQNMRGGVGGGHRLRPRDRCFVWTQI